MFHNLFVINAIFIILLNELISQKEGKTCVEDLSPKPRKMKETSPVEIRSLLVRCSNKEEEKSKHSNQASESRQQIFETRGYNSDESILNPLVTKCKKKMYITMKFHNVVKRKCEEDIIIVDHVIDIASHQRIRLLNPYIFKVNHGKFLQLYALKFMHLVNGEAQEEVINKHCKKFLGCDDSPASRNPTCGFAYEEDTVVPYSQGFCCSCDSVVNMRRQIPAQLGNSALDKKNKRKEKTAESSEQFQNISKDQISQHNILMKEKDNYQNKQRNRDEKHKSKNKNTFFHSQKYSNKEQVNSLRSDSLRDENYGKQYVDRGIGSQYKYPYFVSHNLQKISSKKSRKKYNNPIENIPNYPDYQNNVLINHKIKLRSENLKKPFRINIPIPTPTSPIGNELYSDDSDSHENSADDMYYDDPEDYEKYARLHERKSKRKTNFLKDDHRQDNDNNKLKHKKSKKSQYLTGKTSGKVTKHNDFPSWKKSADDIHEDIKDKAAVNHKSGSVAVNSKSESKQHIKIITPSRNEPKKHNSNERRLSDEERLQISMDNKYKYSPSYSNGNSVLGPNSKRLASGKLIQRRGGQNCADKTAPAFANPTTYHDSAHCLRFSDLWYSVYSLEKPVVDHNVYFHLFERHDCKEGKIWKDITQGKIVRVGTFSRQAMDAIPTYSFTYTPIDEDCDKAFNLDYKTQRLLIPEPVQNEHRERYPQLKGGPKEYLVLKDEMITTSGEECDKAGVSYEAFVKQPNRCDKPRGSCLKNQPIDLWRRDIEARLKGKKGRYFLENFGVVPSDSIKRNDSAREEYLSLEYNGKYTSMVDIEIKADLNALVEIGVLGRITEVYIDGTCSLRTHVYVVVTNTGLASSGFYVKIVDCLPDAPPGWSDQKPVYKKIPPQHVKQFQVTLDGVMQSDRLICSVELTNERHQAIARRRIDVDRRGWCFCMWHCLCACLGGVNGLPCHHMSTEQYHEAGFQGSLPVPTSRRESPFMLILYSSLTFFLVLLLLGAIKGIVGLSCCPLVGAWGLDMLAEHPRQIPHYYEKELQSRTVIYDCGGHPVHPDTKQRTVRTISRTMEFCLNLVFFLLYPCAVCGNLCRRSLPCDLERGDSIDWSKIIIITQQKKPGGKNEYYPFSGEDYLNMERDDTKFVFQELKRSRNSLMRCRCGDENIPLLENDITRNRLQREMNRMRRLEDIAVGSRERDVGQRSDARIPSAMSTQLNPRPYEQETTTTTPGETTTDEETQDQIDAGGAMELVNKLLETKTAFRTFQEPFGNTQVIPGAPYSIMGSFTRRGPGYIFYCDLPLMQVPEYDTARALLYRDMSGEDLKHKDLEGLPGRVISLASGPPTRQQKHLSSTQHSLIQTFWGITDGGFQMLEEPVELDPNYFIKYYQNPEEVRLDASLTNYPKGYCINIKQPEILVPEMFAS